MTRTRQTRRGAHPPPLLSGPAAGGDRPRAATQQRTCELCNCVVHGGQAAWGVHTAGIRHRRNAASSRLFGEPGHLVVSAFEPTEHLAAALAAAAGAALPPGAVAAAAAAAAAGEQAVPASSSRQAHPQGNPAAAAAVAAPAAAAAPRRARGTHQQRREIGRQLKQQRQQRFENPPGAAALLPAVREQLRQTQQAACKHLAALVSVGSKLYSEAGVKFKIETLLSRLLALEVHVCDRPQGAAQQPQQQQGQHAPAPAAAEEAPQPSCLLRWNICPNNSAAAVADAAVLPLVLARTQPLVRRLELTVPYQTFGHAAAATAAAVATFCDSLATAAMQQLSHVSLQFECPDYSTLVGQNPGCFARANSQLWGHVMRALRDAVEFNCTLQQLTLAAFPGQLAADDLAELQTALTAGRRRARTAVLLGSHRVAGADSRLLLLPREVLACVVDLAVPLQPCGLKLELPRQMTQHEESESDSESDDDGSSSGDSSSDESSSSEEGGGH